jgi:histone H1/5
MMSASYIFAALPILALGAIAILGFFWLREPVSEMRSRGPVAEEPPSAPVLETLAESVERVAERSSQLAAMLMEQSRRAAQPGAAKAAAPRAAAWKSAAKPAAAKKPVATKAAASKAAAAKKPAAKPIAKSR